jgi:hypothetical protein
VLTGGLALLALLRRKVIGIRSQKVGVFGQARVLGFLLLVEARDAAGVNRFELRIPGHGQLAICHSAQHLVRREVAHHLRGAHAQGAIRIEARIKRMVVNLLRPQLLGNPLIHADAEHAIHVAGARAKGQAIQRMLGALTLFHGLLRYGRSLGLLLLVRSGQGIGCR